MIMNHVNYYAGVYTLNKLKNIFKNNMEIINGIVDIKGYKFIIEEQTATNLEEWMQSKEVIKCDDLYIKYKEFEPSSTKSKLKFFTELKSRSIDIGSGRNDNEVFYLDAITQGSLVRAMLNILNCPCYFYWKGYLPQNVRIGKNVINNLSP